MARIALHSVGMDYFLTAINTYSVDYWGDDLDDHVGTREAILKFRCDLVLLFVLKRSEGPSRYGLEVELFPFPIWTERSTLSLICLFFTITSMEMICSLRDVPPDVAQVICDFCHDVVEATAIASFEVLEPRIRRGASFTTKDRSERCVSCGVVDSRVV